MKVEEPLVRVVQAQMEPQEEQAPPPPPPRPLERQGAEIKRQERGEEEDNNKGEGK